MLNKKFNQNKIIVSAIYLFFLALILIPQISLAQDPYGLGTAAGSAGLSGSATDIPLYLGRFAGGALALAGSIFLFLVIYGGILILTSAGASEKVNKGKEVIVWAIIGALVLGAAYAITDLVFQVFKK